MNSFLGRGEGGREDLLSPVRGDPTQREILEMNAKRFIQVVSFLGYHLCFNIYLL